MERRRSRIAREHTLEPGIEIPPVAALAAGLVCGVARRSRADGHAPSSPLAAEAPRSAWLGPGSRHPAPKVWRARVMDRGGGSVFRGGAAALPWRAGGG